MRLQAHTGAEVRGRKVWLAQLEIANAALENGPVRKSLLRVSSMIAPLLLLAPGVPTVRAWVQEEGGDTVKFEGREPTC